MNLAEYLLIFIEGFLLAFYIAMSLRLKRDHQGASGAKARAIFLMAAVQMAQKAILALYLFALTIHMQLAPAQNEYAVRLFTPASHGLIVLLGAPFLCLTAYYIVRAQKANIRTALAYQLIIVLALTLYILTGWSWMAGGMQTFLLLFIAYINIYVIVHLRKYEKRLNQLYSNTSNRGVYWIFSFLLINALQGVLWGVLCMYLEVTMARIVFYVESIVMDEIYVYMLEMQNYDVEEMTASAEEGVRAEVVTEKAEEKNALELALKQLDLEIPRYCKEEGHFTDPELSVIDLTEAVNSNRTYVAKWFSLRGENFNTYINELRVEYAEQRLRTTSLSPNDICAMAGFSTTHTFARVFKAKYGCTPAQYRAKLNHDVADDPS